VLQLEADLVAQQQLSENFFRSETLSIITDQLLLLLLLLMWRRTSETWKYMIWCTDGMSAIRLMKR
jgi:hypothetical protein